MIQNATQRPKIGILGGSFNPPHLGHVHILQQAKSLLDLDQVWMLPVPLNTLKNAKDIAPFEKRLAWCEILADPYDWIEVKDIEAVVGTNQTIDTVKHLKNHFPNHDFTWLMGADSFASVHDWGPSAAFIEHMKAAVFARSEAENRAAQQSVTALKYPIKDIEAFKAADEGWLFFDIEPHLGRATFIRNGLQAGQFIQELPDELRQVLMNDDFYVKS